MPGSSTKKPPLTQPPSPFGFSWNVSDCRARRSSSIAPKRPIGWTAVTRRELAVLRGGSSIGAGDVDVGDAVTVGEQERLAVHVRRESA